MFTTTPAYASAIQLSHRMCSKAQLWSAGAYVQDLQLVTGSVQGDFTATNARQTSDLVIFDPTNTLTPTGATSLLAPNGNELKLFRGIEYTDPTISTAVLALATANPLLYPYVTTNPDNGNAQEYVPIGMLGISVAQIVAAAKTAWQTQLTCYDRSRRVARAKTVAPFQLAAGFTPRAAIQALLLAQCGRGVVVGGWLTTAMMSFASDGQLNMATLGALSYDINTDVWAACQDIADGAGASLLFDASGILQLKTILDPISTPAVKSYIQGEGNGMVTFTRRFDDEFVVNTWTVTGGGSSAAPIFATVQNLNFSDPYSVQNYGEVGDRIDSPAITTLAMAQAAAQAKLTLSSGLVEDIQWTGVVDGSLDLYDVIQATVPEVSMNSKYLIQTLNIPVDAATAMQGTTRQLPVGS